MDDLRRLEYPRHVHWPSVPGDWQSRIVKNAEECEQALAEGYSLTPVIQGSEPAPPADPPDQVPTPVDSTVDTPAAAPKKRRGRKPKE